MHKQNFKLSNINQRESLETLGQFYQIKHTNVDIFMSLWTPKSSTFETLII